MGAWDGRLFEALKIYGDKRVLLLLFLGFASGLPLLLTASTLAIRLTESGVTKTAIGIFALVGLPYAFKFLWAPAIDRLPLPFFTKALGRRRGWVVCTQLFLILSLLGLGFSDPDRDVLGVALWAFAVAFCSASQDVVIDAYRVEILEKRLYGAGAATLVFGYRAGLLVAGAGALYLATYFGWETAYVAMAGLVSVGLVTILLAPEPVAPEPATLEPAARGRDGAAAFDRIRAWLRGAVLAPFQDFLTRPQWAVILLFVVFYKFGDALAGVMANPFYLEIGFTKIEIANVSKLFGLGATLFGALAGGILVARYGILKSLLVAGVLQMASNAVFALQAAVGSDLGLLFVTIGFENFAGGMGTTAFVAYLSSLCHLSYTATQYALLSSLMSVGRTLFSAPGGWLADQVDWIPFFLVTTAAAVPGLLLLLWIRRSPGTALR
ncbi:AmpG family muropeptide MFS transporter [Rhodospirillaceae bacterium AH-315-P19]|nr:AmpG family muropeptide MFS transporter [Rhodospirillaceae bacterium AH-315-P19]